MAKVFVLGSFVADLTALASHLPVKGETVKGDFFRIGPGGKGGNQAVAAARAGGDTVFLSKVGADTFGNMALENFKKEGIDIRFIYQDPSVDTGTALIMVSESGDNQILVVPGASEHVLSEELTEAEKAISESDVFLTQLEINVDATIDGIRLARKHGVPVIFNPAPVQAIDSEVLSHVEVITPNEVEAEILSGVAVKTIEDCHRAARVFFEKGVKKVVITLGSAGVYANNRERYTVIPCCPVKAVDTTGAGDAFNGAFAMALAEGMYFFEAVDFANTAAALSVTRFGTAPAMATRKEINQARAEWDISYEIREFLE